MRLLTQPIYRYENVKGDLIDGAMFVFPLGTDPEAFLLIEAHRPQGGPAEWRFGAARMNGINLRVNHRGREVWNAPQIPWCVCGTPRSRILVFTSMANELISRPPGSKAC